MLRGSRNRSKNKKEVDKLMELLDIYNKSQVPCVQKMHKLIPIDNMYLERLEGNFNNYGGLKYYNSYEDYINNTVVPCLKKQKNRIGDLR
ncbi:hypothetical protein [Terrisporobacter petrolearius]|uniref:hypothetical protein n=1 Tax=Terrisporobacter petrolearius TaxID=1460447 RepID=UPI0022E19DF1|nr:hypothetical protein [Terrisporobacter petrolearius]